MSELGRSQGLFASVRQLLGTVLEFAQIRIALISNEIEQEKLRLFGGLLWAGLALLMLGLGALLLTIFIVVLFWDSYRLQALGGLAILFLSVGSGLLGVAYTRLRKPGGLFHNSAEELFRDRVAMGAEK